MESSVRSLLRSMRRTLRLPFAGEDKPVSSMRARMRTWFESPTAITIVTALIILNAALFFVVYILIATFTVLNLFIAVIVDAMHRRHVQHEAAVEQPALARIEQELALLRQAIEGRRP